MRIAAADYRVNEGSHVDLNVWPTIAAPVYRSAKDYRRLLAEHIEKLSALQDRFYACNQSALLLILQGMDAAGKDGAIKHVMSGVNPQGCQVHSFKAPTAAELEHDFLWRTTRELPARGQIGIFNRSYYEEVLVIRVHPELLRAEGLAKGNDGDKKLWHHRYRSIVELESHLSRNGTRILKVFLHLSKNEQRARFIARIDDPNKNWKFGMADIEERSFWDAYRRAYEHCLAATSTNGAPWYVVPADDKDNARLIMSGIILEALEDMNLVYPKGDGKHRSDLRAIRAQLQA